MKFPVKFYFGDKALTRRLEEEERRNRRLVRDKNRAIDSLENELQRRTQAEQQLRQLKEDLSKSQSINQANEAIDQSNTQKINQLEAEINRLHQEYKRQLETFEESQKKRLESLLTKHKSELSQQRDVARHLLSTYIELFQTSEFQIPIHSKHVAMVSRENPFYGALVIRNDYRGRQVREFLYLPGNGWRRHIRRIDGANEIVVAGLPLDYETIDELQFKTERLIIVADDINFKFPTSRRIQVLSLDQYANQDPTSVTIADFVRGIESDNVQQSEYTDIVCAARFHLPHGIISSIMEDLAASGQLHDYEHQETVQQYASMYRQAKNMGLLD